MSLEDEPIKVPPRFGIPSDGDYDEASTRKWILSLPDSALQRIAHGLHEFGDRALYSLIEDEWWARHGTYLDSWPTVELNVPVTLKAIIYCGQRVRNGLGASSLGPFDSEHQPSRKLPFFEEGDTREQGEEEYWIECKCGWKESQGPFPQFYRVGAWWWPTVTHWNEQHLDKPKLIVCGQASTPYDVNHAPKNYVRRIDLAEASEEVAHVPAANGTTEYLFTRCICGAQPYWPEHFRLYEPTDEELDYLKELEKKN